MTLNPTWTAVPAALSSRESVANGTASGGKVPSLLIQEAEEHWDVSGTSVLVAWIVTAFGSLIIFTLFSWRRQRAVRLQEPDVLIYLPRYWARKEKEAEKQEGVFTNPVSDVSIVFNRFVGLATSACYISTRFSMKDEADHLKVDLGFFAWLTPLWHDVVLESRFWRAKAVLHRDYQMLEQLGLDAVTYLQFLRLLRWLFATISLLVAGPLVCGNYYINTATQWGSTDSNLTSTSSTTSENTTSGGKTSMLDDLQLFTAANITGNGLYVHIAVEWIVTLLVSAFGLGTGETCLTKDVRNVSEISFKTIMVSGCDIQPEVNGQLITVAGAKEEVCSYFDPKVPVRTRKRAADSINCSVVHRKDAVVTLTHQDMSQLSARMDKYVKKSKVNFERHLTGWLRRDGNGPVTHYASCGDCLMARRKNLVQHARETGKERAAIEQERIAVKAEFMQRGDSNKLRRTVTSAFIAFRTARDAHQKILSFQRRSVTQIQEYNMGESRKDATDAEMAQSPRNGAVSVICFLNTIPLIAITVLANLNVLSQQLPFLDNLQKSSVIWKGIFATISGILPASISAACSYFLPYLMRKISRFSGAMSRCELDKDVIRQLFIFLLVSNFVVFSLLGVLYEPILTLFMGIGKQSLGQIYRSFGGIPAKVTQAYISESSYWLSWYPIRAALVCLQILQVPRWLLTFYQTFFGVKTGSDIKEMARPANFEYAIEYSPILFAMVVALVYTPLAPIVVICGTIYFWAASFIFYMQLKYVEETKETDGKLWRLIVNRLLTACVIMQLLMTLTVALKTKSAQMCLLSAVPNLFIVILRHSIDKKIHSSSDLVGLDPSTKPGSPARREAGTLQLFEHWLLRDKWEPIWGFVPSDWEKFKHVMGDKINQLKCVEPISEAGASAADAEKAKAKEKDVEKEKPKQHTAEEKQLAEELLPVLGGKDEEKPKPKKRRGWRRRRHAQEGRSA